MKTIFERAAAARAKAAAIAEAKELLERLGPTDHSQDSSSSMRTSRLDDFLLAHFDALHDHPTFGPMVHAADNARSVFQAGDSLPAYLPSMWDSLPQDKRESLADEYGRQRFYGLEPAFQSAMEHVFNDDERRLAAQSERAEHQEQLDSLRDAGGLSKPPNRSGDMGL